MEESEKGKEEKKKNNKIRIFQVPIALEEIKENIFINSSISSKISKEQLINQAFNFHSQGKILEASKYYQYLINQGFKDHRVFSNYGSILKSLGKLEEAEKSTRKAIELKPDFAEAYSNLGSILIDLGKLKEAEIPTLKAIELKPNYANAYSNYGSILKSLGKLQEAEICQRKAIKLNPDFAEAYSNLGSILIDLGKLKEAEIPTRKAIKLKPNYANAYSNLGTILKDIGKLKEAERCQRKAIKLNPDFAEAYSHLSYLELLNGDYKSGLENYEFRFKTKKPPITHGKTKLKRIDNTNVKKVKKLLVLAEQGLGDTLQYMRYIPYLRKQGFDISLSAQEKLHSLIKSSGIDPNPLTPEQAVLVSEGQWIPLLSLPRYLKINPENAIISEPYIFSKDELNQKWKNIFLKERKPIIGINWQGNPNIENSYQGRSIPLEIFSIITNNNDIQLLSLQKGFGSEQLGNCSFKNRFVKCQPQINSTWDFLENAAIIENCDLIITCDTSIAHLAGGMGKNVWLLLRDIPFWTWGLQGDNTFWYPSMRLFRQKKRDDWSEVMIRVSSRIKQEIEAKN